ncbi:MAG: GPR endopeptidase [Christensenellaceae bacterium]|jgi:spore protease|nr:GPR endopeptidase [Christensenellaceae bacterium]
MSFLNYFFGEAGYTDLASELIKKPRAHSGGVSVDIERKPDYSVQWTRITNEAGAEKLNKPIGTYVNIDGEDIPPKEIFAALREIIENDKKILVIGLGNEYFIADSLGIKVCDFVRTGARIKSFTPSVYAVTGIESAAIIKSVVREVKPTCVLIVDSLVCRDETHIGKSFQIADSGISPASALRQHTHELSKRTLGVPVVAIGVPLCMRLSNGLLVLPKDIDAVVVNSANLIAKAINLI